MRFDIKASGGIALGIGLAITMSALSSAGALAGDSVTKQYIAPPWGDVLVVNSPQDILANPKGQLPGATSPCRDTSEPAFGGVCFEVGSNTSIDLAIKDDVDPNVGGNTQFVDSKGNTVGKSTFFCNSANGVAIPAGAFAMYLFIGIVNANYDKPGSLDCGTNPSAGTHGKVTANFSGGGGAYGPVPASSPTSPSSATASAVSSVDVDVAHVRGVRAF